MPDKLTTEQLERELAKLALAFRQCATSKIAARTLWDAEVKGFGARLYPPTNRKPKGAASFFLNYRFEGVERRFTIGDFGTWTVTAARAEAKERSRQVDRGRDITVEKRERRDAPTVQDLIDRYKTDHLPTKTAKRKNDELKMLAEIGEHLGLDRKVADVHFGDIEAMHKKITATDSPSKRKRYLAGKGRPVRANRVLAVASKMFALSLLPRVGETKPWRDAVQGNPCKGVKKNVEVGKERFYSEIELAAISDALTDVKIGSAADCLRLIMLTGCRPDEAMNAAWVQMDAEPGYWIKRSAHVKQRRDHKLALNPPALELIGRLRKQRDADAAAAMDASPWVFPGQNRPDQPLRQIWRVWHGVRERATLALWAQGNEKVVAVIADLNAMLGRNPTADECKAEAGRRGLTLPVGLLDGRPYDFRHTFASIGASGGLGLPVIGRLLGHTQSRTTQRYAHLADDPLKEATDKIGAVIANAGRPGAEVMRLPRGRAAS
jgi:integrase